MIGVLIRRGKFGHRHTGEKANVNTEANTGAMHLYTRERQGLPAVPRNKEEILP